jgi:hypothetical protein
VSEIASSARVNVLLADFANNDAGKRVNLLGAGWQICPLDPQTGLTLPQSLVVIVNIPPEHYEEDFSVEIVLYDDANNAPVEIPGPTGSPIPLRIGQVAKAEKPSVPGQFLPAKAIWSQVQFIINFPGGLAVTAGRSYTWQVRIDGDDEYLWKASFYVPGPPPLPVVG